jgi:hypothetical protein
MQKSSNESDKQPDVFKFIIQLIEKEFNETELTKIRENSPESYEIFNQKTKSNSLAEAIVFRDRIGFAKYYLMAVNEWYQKEANKKRLGTNSNDDTENEDSDDEEDNLDDEKDNPDHHTVKEKRQKISENDMKKIITNINENEKYVSIRGKRCQQAVSHLWNRIKESTYHKYRVIGDRTFLFPWIMAYSFWESSVTPIRGPQETLKRWKEHWQSCLQYVDQIINPELLNELFDCHIRGLIKISGWDEIQKFASDFECKRNQNDDNVWWLMMHYLNIKKNDNYHNNNVIKFLLSRKRDYSPNDNTYGYFDRVYLDEILEISKEYNCEINTQTISHFITLYDDVKILTKDLTDIKKKSIVYENCGSTDMEKDKNFTINTNILEKFVLFLDVAQNKNLTPSEIEISDTIKILVKYAKKNKLRLITLEFFEGNVDD